MSKNKKDETRILDESSLHANDNNDVSDEDGDDMDQVSDADDQNSDVDGDDPFPVTDDMDGSLHRRLDNEDDAAQDRIVKSSMKKRTSKTKPKRRKKSSSSLVEDEAELSSDVNNSSDDEDGEDLDNYEADGFVCDDDAPIVYDEELVAGKKRLKKEQTSKSKRKHKRIIADSDSDDVDSKNQDEDSKIKDLRNGLVKLQSLSQTSSAATAKTNGKPKSKPVLNKMSDIMLSRAVVGMTSNNDDIEDDKENIDPITGKVVPLSKIKKSLALSSESESPLSVSKKPSSATTASQLNVKSKSGTTAASKTTKPLTGQEAIEREREREKARSSTKPKTQSSNDTEAKASKSTKSNKTKPSKELIAVTTPAIQAYQVGKTFKFEDNKAKDADDKPVNGTYRVTCRGLNAPYDRDDNVIISKCTTKMYTTALRVGTTNVYQTFLVADQQEPYYLTIGNATKIEQATKTAASRLDTARGCDNLQAVNDGTTNNRCIVPMSYYISSNRKREKAAAKALITKSKERFSDSATKVMDVCMKWFASKDPQGMEKLITEADEKWKQAIAAGDSVAGDDTDPKIRAAKDDAITKKATLLFSKNGDKAWIREMMIFMFLYEDEYRGMCKKELLCGATPPGGMELAENGAGDEDSGENTQEDD